MKRAIFDQWRSRLLGWVEELRRREDQLALVLSLVIGALVGLVVVAFMLLTSRLAAHLFPVAGGAWRRALIPLLGSVVTGFLLRRYFPSARGSGIPQTKAALAIHDGRISFRTVAGKFLCCSTSLASGIALGREGPAVQIGAGLASVIARRLRLGKDNVKALVPVGCAAALAAAFNTPIAAVLFALEEIVGDLHASILGSVVLSAATSWVVLHLVLGDEPLFHVTPYHLVHPIEFSVYLALGVIGGLGSVGFVKLVLRMRRWFLILPSSTVWIQPAAGGLAVGLIGYFIPDILGVGYGVVERALAGDLLLATVVALAALKIVATATSYASGNAGGIFGPSLFIGAMLGGAVGGIAHAALPAYTAGPGAYALVGMGAAFAGIIRTPLTSVIMIFEVTRDYSIIVPLMIANLMAYFISRRLQPEPIYEALARQDGIHLPVAGSRRTAGASVGDALRSVADPLPASMETTIALKHLEGKRFGSWPVVDQGALVGMVRTRDLEAASRNQPTRTVAELVGFIEQDPSATMVHLHPDQSLTVALERMGATGHDVLPVVSRANARHVLGVVTLEDVLRAYGLQPPEVRFEPPKP